MTRHWIEDLAEIDMIIYKDGTTSKLDIFPKGAKIVGIEWSIVRDCLILAVEHESYESLPEGAEPPYEMLVAEDVNSRHYYSEANWNKKEAKKS